MHIIIPMSGKGQRFVDAGYSVPKPLIVVDGKPMLQHVIDLTPGEHKFTFICNHTHLTTTNMREQILSMVDNANIIEIPDHELGPVYTIMQAIDQIEDDEEIIINHCDFGTYWDYKDFLKHTRDRNADGVVVGYKGFHPHMLGTTKYASMRDDKQWMLEIQEKAYFTDDPMSEYVSNGTYYFKSGGIVKKYFKELMDINLVVKGEYFVSLVYNMMLRDALKVSIFEIQHMLQWGIPRDVEDYNAWSAYFRNKIQEDECNSEKYTCDIALNIVAEQESKEKPLMEVNGHALFLEAASSFSEGKENIFVYRENKIDENNLKDTISQSFKNFQLKKLEDEQQSLATMYYKGLCDISEGASLQINASDNGVLFDNEAYQELLSDDEVDGIVWVHKHYRYSEDHPEKFNWVEVENAMLTNISQHKQISDNPYHDQIAIGTYTLKKVKYFREAYDVLVQEETVDTDTITIEDVINQMLSMGIKIKIFEVRHYVSWKTEDELKTYAYWQSFFHKVDWHPYQLKCDGSINTETLKILESKYRNFGQNYR